MEILKCLCSVSDLMRLSSGSRYQKTGVRVTRTGMTRDGSMSFPMLYFFGPRFVC